MNSILISGFCLSFFVFAAGDLGFEFCMFVVVWRHAFGVSGLLLINNNNRRLVTLAEHTSDHGRQTNSSTEEKGEQV